MSAITSVSTSCIPSQGNSDFYGQGIRIGVYLQWVSAWISILVQPDTAQSVLEVNSIFVFAVVIANIAAYNFADIQPIETYIMLQLSFGFFLTTISIFGLRLQLLQSQVAAQLCRAITGLPTALRQSLITPGNFSNLKRFINGLSVKVQRHPGDSLLNSIAQHLWRGIRDYSKAVTEILTTRFELGLGAFTFIRLRGLAWSGILWRSEIAGVLAGFNLVFWFSTGSGSAESFNDCVPAPKIFLFSEQPLRGPVLTFFRVGAVMAGVVVLIPALFLVILSCRLFVFLCRCVVRDLLWRRHPGAREVAREAWADFQDLVDMIPVRMWNRSFQLPGTGSSPRVLGLRSWRDVMEFWLSAEVANIRMTDILKLCASLAGADVVVERHRTTLVENSASSRYKIISRASTLSEHQIRTDRSLVGSVRKFQKLGIWASVLWNISTAAIIAWFILSIELTIKWNGIQGVDTIQSAGQLIPLIIGVASSASALETVVVASIKKVNKRPDPDVILAY